MMNFLGMKKIFLISVVTSLILSGCGGAAPGAGTSTTPTTPPTSTASSLDLTVSSVSIPSASTGAAAQVTVTVTAKDSANKTVVGAPVEFSVSSGSITQSASETDENGIVSATLNKGSSKANRTITVTATSGSLSATQTVEVVGSVLNAQASKVIIPLNSATETITYTLQDSAGNPIVGEEVEVIFSLGGQTVTSAPTNASGVATISIPASAVAASSVASATAAGATKSLSLTYSSTPTPTPTPTPTDFTVQANPAVVNVNTAGSFANSSQIVVTVTGAGGALVDNALVSFRRGDSNSAASTFENTNDIPSSTGIAINRIRPGTQSSGQNEIVVCASVKNGSGVSITPTTPYSGSNANPCLSTEKPVFLTFSGSPLFVTISSGSTIEDVDTLNYRKRFSVLVTDNAGRPIENATISTVVRPKYYGKGYFAGPVPTKRTTSFPTDISPYIPPNQGSLWCPNEDLNNDGLLQTGEDFNTSGDIEPRQVAALTAANSGKTDSTGFLILSLEYGKRFATWVVVEIEVRAQVGGSEGVAIFTYYLIASKEDADSIADGAAPGFEYSPFGTNTGTSVTTENFGGKAAPVDCKTKG